MSDRAIVVIRVIKTFLCSSSVYSCHLFFISSASVRSLPFLSFIVPILAWNVPLICSVFMKRPLIFPILLFSSISLHCSFKKSSSSPSLLFPGTLHSVRYLSRFLPCLLFFFSPQLFVKPPQTTTLLSCISFFFFFEMGLVIASCTMSWTSAHSSSGTLTTRSNPFNLFVLCTV